MNEFIFVGFLSSEYDVLPMTTRMKDTRKWKQKKRESRVVIEVPNVDWQRVRFEPNNSTIYLLSCYECPYDCSYTRICFSVLLFVSLITWWDMFFVFKLDHFLGEPEKNYSLLNPLSLSHLFWWLSNIFSWLTWKINLSTLSLEFDRLLFFYVLS